jgi:hypothetical protein
MRFFMNSGDSNEYILRAYLLDWDGTTRDQECAVCDSHTLEVYSAVYGTDYGAGAGGNFHDGLWLSWRFSGEVFLRVTNTGFPNGVIGGIFFDPYVVTSAYVASPFGISSAGVAPANRLS